MIRSILKQSSTFPLLPLRDMVVFPGMIAPLFVGRAKSINALDNVVKQNGSILLVTQKDANNDNPKPADLHGVGVLANVLQLLKLPDGTVKVLIEGQRRVKVYDCEEDEHLFFADVEVIDDVVRNKNEMEALVVSVVNQFGKYAKQNKKIAPEVLTAVTQLQDASRIADTIASHIKLDIAEQQKILESPDVMVRLEKLFTVMESEMDVLDTEKKIRTRIKRQMEKTHKEYYLNEQLKAIHKELGEGEDGKDEIGRLEATIKKTKLSKEAKQKALVELKKLKSTAPMAAEATVIRNYLEWMVSIPWNKRSKIKSDINSAQEVLDADHYGLEKIKERILEYLAVQQRTKRVGGSVLCLVGPPGVGKTSLARSIARAIGRKFVKISLGGVRDESEIRGHRRTYIGSMPGKIVQSMKKAGTSNPLFLLDEIDKMGSDFRGDPASALLEVLDPEQNTAFNDHYLEVDYDLSDVMFVTTANSLNIPHALLDRLEVVRISGYTEEEKVCIAERHLIPKQYKINGMKENEWEISEDGLKSLIRYYTREAGVRNLERELARLVRKALRKILTGELTEVAVTKENVGDFLGVQKYNYGETHDDDLVGVVNGLAYTEVGGDILTIEALRLPGKGNVKSTGKLGEVMQESAQAAFSFARACCLSYGITPIQYGKKDIHIHVPEGATPKDGPSAGVAMCVAIISVMTGIPVRKSVAMTGEVTLRGRALAIGGLKEKLLAALRGGVKTVLIPKENEKDLTEIPDNVKDGLDIIPITTVDDALGYALTKVVEPIEWQDIEEMPTKIVENVDHVVTH